MISYCAAIVNLPIMSTIILMMDNERAAKILQAIADYLEMDRVAFKPQAYRKAAQMIAAQEEDIAALYERGGLKALRAIPGIGEAIAKKLEEFIKTGHIKYYDELVAKTPIALDELLAIEGLGPHRARVIFEKLGVRTVADLEKAIAKHDVANLDGFGQRTEANILQGIAFLKKSTGRFPVGTILPKANAIVELIKKLPEVKKISLAGSLRRGRETIGDVDVLVVSDNPAKVMGVFTAMPGIEKIWGKGMTKSSVRLASGFDADLRVVPTSSFGAALQYFTGSKEHNIRLRTIAIEKGLKLNEYGLFRGKEMLKSATEEEIYRQLGMDWIPPEMREDQGEVAAAQSGHLPHLVELGDIKGDLHCHSDWDGGENPIMKLVEKAKSLGYQYIGIADHTKFLRIENGLDEQKLLERNQEIDRLNGQLTGFRILKGCETNIMADGSIDIADNVLAEMDYVIAGVHSQLRMKEEEMTRRIIAAMENPHVDILAHPTGRLVQKRDEYLVNMEGLFKAAKRTGTILEIDAFPDRLDLNAHNIRSAKEMGVAMVIDTDTHMVDHMDYMYLGVMQARRGWAEKKDIINTGSVADLLKRLKH